MYYFKNRNRNKIKGEIKKIKIIFDISRANNFFYALVALENLRKMMKIIITIFYSLDGCGESKRRKFDFLFSFLKNPHDLK